MQAALAEARSALSTGDVPVGALVVDEAGTAGTRDMGRLLDEVARTGAKVVLSGDAKQLPEIAAGGLFAALTERLGLGTSATRVLAAMARP